MNLTEPQAGSDLAAVKSRAVPDGDHYRLSGQKIFITWGDQDFTDNIVHLVLARLPDAPPGIKGISLFLVPKFLVNADGSRGARNDVFPASIEHKLGIHGSPTCVMNYGDNGGAAGWLVGEPHGGIALMFTMMNHARIAVGIQGLSISERAFQQARGYALERVQGQPAGNARGTIIQHPDVRRMLMQMKSGIEAMRGLCYLAAASADHAHHAQDAVARQRHERRFALLTPIVKGWCTEFSQEITSLGVQVHGGMGYIEETGAAQHFRDARITTIYEGTTGIQANDLISRKLLRDKGAALGELVADMQRTAAALAGAGTAVAAGGRVFRAAVELLEQTAGWVIAHQRDSDALPGAVAVNFLLGAGTVCGAWVLSRAALATDAGGGADAADYLDARRELFCFYCEHLLPRATALLQTVRAGADSVMALRPEQF
jgi:alkylation response protein AidB-like acyl-CoA dehydrogenase